jgi:hypothetical protein
MRPPLPLAFVVTIITMGSGCGTTSPADTSPTVSGPCPAVAPHEGDPCARVDLGCEYGADPNPNCNSLAECKTASGSLQWTIRHGVGSGLFAGSCPTRDGGASCSGGATLACSDGLSCNHPSGRCACVHQIPGDAGPPTPPTLQWVCDGAGKSCPAQRPVLGSVCDTAESTTCTYHASCIEMSCHAGVWVLGTSSPCLSP